MVDYSIHILKYIKAYFRFVGPPVIGPPGAFFRCLVLGIRGVEGVTLRLEQSLLMGGTLIGCQTYIV